MKKLTVVLVFSLFVIGLAGVAGAQSSATHDVTININDIAEVNVNGSDISLTVTAPGAGGSDPQGDSNTDAQLQYTSVVSSTTRLVSAKISAGSVPSGLSLAVQPTGTPGTNEGTYGSSVTLTATDQNLVTGVGSCATGTGASDGATLSYSLSVDDPTQLDYGDDTTVTITYTLTDDS